MKHKLLILTTVVVLLVVSTSTKEEKQKEDNVLSEKQTTEKANEKEPEENIPETVHINSVKVVQDNVTGDKHSSFSEDKSSNRGDEKSISDIKKEFDEKVKENEKNKINDAKSEVNKNENVAAPVAEKQENIKQDSVDKTNNHETPTNKDKTTESIKVLDQNDKSDNNLNKNNIKDNIKVPVKSNPKESNVKNPTPIVNRNKEVIGRDKKIYRPGKRITKASIEEDKKKEMETVPESEINTPNEENRETLPENVNNEVVVEGNVEELEFNNIGEILESFGNELKKVLTGEKIVEEEEVNEEEVKKMTGGNARERSLKTYILRKEEKDAGEDEVKMNIDLSKGVPDNSESDKKDGLKSIIADLEKENKKVQETLNDALKEQDALLKFVSENEQKFVKPATQIKTNAKTLPDANPSTDTKPSTDSQPSTVTDTKTSEDVETDNKLVGEGEQAIKEHVEKPASETHPDDKEKEKEKGDGLFNEATQILSLENKDYKKAHELYSQAADLHHTESMEKISYPLLFGEHIKRNITRAVELFEKLAEQGRPHAQQGLGFLYGTGINVISSQAKALIYTTFGALGGNAQAQMMLAYRHHVGVNVARNCESALTYYKKVAKTVSEQVTQPGGVMVQRVRLYDELEQPGGLTGQIDEDLLQYYQFLADKGDTLAQIGLGQLYFQGGRGVEVNYEKAYKYFQLAAQADNGNGLAYLGKMYFEGLFVKKDLDIAYKYFEKAIEQANPIGQSGMGVMYLKGEGVKKDYTQAMKYFSQSAEQGWAEGQLQLGNMYYNGFGVKRDYKKAVQYFTFATQSGHVLAFYNLGQMHATGFGVMRSCSTAVEFFKNVAERGKWSTLFMEAYDAYKSGDLETALLKYYYLAELGYEVAQSNVAYILDKDQVDMFNENQTYSRALLQWSRAAQQGYSVARVKVGDYHYYGLGTKVDFEAAAQHYRLASDQQNNPQALFNLGYMHENGLGLKQDMHLAKRFYDMAALASPDAQLPVFFALSKLAVLFSWEWMQNKYNSWNQGDVTAEVNKQWMRVVKSLGPDWDVYVITMLVGLLGALLLFRRILVN